MQGPSRSKSPAGRRDASLNRRKPWNIAFAQRGAARRTVALATALLLLGVSACDTKTREAAAQAPQPAPASSSTTGLKLAAQCTVRPVTLPTNTIACSNQEKIVQTSPVTGQENAVNVTCCQIASSEPIPQCSAAACKAVQNDIDVYCRDTRMPPGTPVPIYIDGKVCNCECK